MRRAAIVLAVGLVAVGCSAEQRPGSSPTTTAATSTTATEPEPATTSTTSDPKEDNSAQEFPDVIDVEVSIESPGVFRFAVTISSPYDTAQRYADAWRIIAPDGSVLGIRELLHDHANEQPFTRSLNGVEIPPDIEEVTVEGRDLVNGWGGMTLTVPVP